MIKLSPAQIATITWSIIAVSLVTAFVTRIVFLFYRDIDFSSGDEARDAYVYAAMRYGIRPSLGPAVNTLATGTDWYLPPLYYYLVFPFTLLSRDPSFAALSSATFSFLTIPLLIFTLYRLFDGLPHARRLFWAAVGGLWWSVMVNDIILGTRPWNPSLIPFFILAFTLVSSSSAKEKGRGKGMASWIFLGVLFATLVSLHPTTLFVFPIVFALVAVRFITSAPSRSQAFCLVLLSLVTAGACLTPYWVSEFHNNWHNSQSMIPFTHVAASRGSILEKCENALRAYAWLNGLQYFISSNLIVRLGGLVFLIAIIPVSCAVFRGNRSLAVIFISEWLIFLCAAAAWNADETRYRLIISMAPLFLTMSSLAFLNYAYFSARVLGACIVTMMLVSMITNISMEIQHEGYRFGPSRLIASSDIVTALKKIPYGSSICDSNESDRYIDDFITHRNLRFLPICLPGTYEIVPKFISPIWSGSDTMNNFHDGYLGYLMIPHTLISGPLPTGARMIMENDALDLVFNASGSEAAPARTLHR